MPVPPGCAFLIDPVPDDVFVLEDFGEEARAMARTAQEFVDREVIPRLGEIEEKKHGVVPDLLRRAGEIGLLAIEVPEAYGGLGLDKSTALLVSERAAKLGSFSISWGAHTGIGTLPIVYYGSEAQKQHYLPKLASGEWLAAYALTEPGSGSDALAAATTARRDGDHWVLTGTKQFITNAGFADLFTVFAQADGKVQRVPGRAHRPGRHDRAPRSRSSGSRARRRASSCSTTRASPPTGCSARWAAATRSRSTS